MYRPIILYCWFVALLVSFFFPLSTYASGKEVKGKMEAHGLNSSSKGVNAGISPNLDLPPEQARSLESLNSTDCTYWWIYGRSSWNWSGIPYVYISYNSNGKSWTEYGTSTGGCGIPLTVDRLYVRVQEYPANSWPYTSYDKTVNNTNYVERGNSGWCTGCTNICGAYGWHNATKNGVYWSTTTSSGCAP